MIDAIRGAATAVLVVFVGIVLGLSLASRLAPLVDRELFAIRGGSMGSGLPVGSLVVGHRTDRVEPGMVVTYRTPSGAAVTHRAVRVVVAASGTYVETRGDANPSADPTLVPLDAIAGVAVLTFPALGFLLGLLAMPIGIMAIATTAGTLVGLLIVLDEASIRSRTRSPMPRRAAASSSTP